MLLKKWIPAAVFLVTFTSTILIWRALVDSEQGALRRHVSSTAVRAREFIRDELENHAQSISRLGKSRELSSAEPVWRSDAQLLIESDPAYKGIVLTGPGRAGVSIVPDDMPSQVMADERSAKAFTAAKLTGAPVVSPPVGLAGGRLGFIIAVPLSEGRNFGGVVAGLFESREFVKNVLGDSRHELDGHIISVSALSHELYRSSAELTDGWEERLTLEYGGADWQIVVWPGQETVSRYITSLPQAIFALGSISSGLLAALVFFAQANKIKTGDLERANEMLKAEVRQRAVTGDELRRSDEKFRSLVETMSDLIWEIDRDFRYSYVSPRITDVLGYSQAEVLGKTPWDFMPLAEAGKMKKMFAEAFEAKEPMSLVENVNIRKDGALVVLETSGSPVFDKEGVFSGYRGVDRNVTPRKKAEEALKRTNERLQNAQRISRLGSWDWDIEKDELHWSDEIYRIFGVEPGEFGATYEAFLGFVHPEDRMAVHRAVTESLTLRKPYSIEHRIVLADGTLKVIHEQGEVRFNAAGNPASMSGTVQDVTERKQIDEQLRLYRDHLRELVEERTAELNGLNEKLKFEVEIRKKAEEAVTRMNEDLEKRAVELERVNKELEAFTYSASHDLQEPLRVISGYVQLIGRRYKSRLDKDADEFISYAVDGVARMQRLITDLLSYSRVGRFSSLSPVDFEAALGRVKANLSVAIEESGALIRNGGLPVVLADESQIDQLLMNLVSNAIKYRGRSTPLITVNASKEGQEWVFSVSDNGIGIDPKYSAKVFDIFQRLHRSAEYPGTGIGLSICKKVVENHGGRIWVESLPGAGSTFYFTLPDKEAAHA